MRYKGPLIAWSLCAAVLGCGVRSQIPPGVFVSPTVQDFGTVTDERTVRATFTLANNTSEPVRIVHVSPSCRCVNLQISDNVIPVRGSVTAFMTVNLKGISGKREFQSLLATDSPWAPVLRLELRGTVAVTVLDGTIPFDIGAFPPGAEISETVSLSKAGHPNARITAVEQSENEFLTIHGSSVAPADALKLRVVGRAPNRAGTFETVANVSAEGMSWKRAKIVVRGTVRARWTFPSEIYLGFVRRGGTLEKEFTIADAFPEGRTQSVLREVRVSSNCRSLEATAKVERSSARVTLKLRNTDDVGSIDCQVEVALKTADGKEEVIEIPVHARVFGVGGR
jgi:hypothetical protein